MKTTDTRSLIGIGFRGGSIESVSGKEAALGRRPPVRRTSSRSSNEDHAASEAFGVADAPAESLPEETGRIEHFQQPGEVDSAKAHATTLHRFRKVVLPVAIGANGMNPEPGVFRTRSEPSGPSFLNELGLQWPLLPRHAARLESVLLFHDHIVVLPVPRPHGVCSKKKAKSHPGV